MKYQSQKHGGFTLIEMVVVLAIFFIIIAVAVSVLTSVIDRQRSILAEQELLNQTSYVVNYVSTVLKMATPDSSGTCLGTAGTVYLLTHCPNGTSQACNGIKFINPLESDACEEIFLDTTTNPQDPTLNEIKNGSSEQNILSPKFPIKYASFIIDGNKALHSATSQDSVQPKITMLLDILTGATSGNQEKIIQTTISLRNLIP